MFKGFFKNKKGMTLVEVLITLSVSGIIMTMIFEIVTTGLKNTGEIEARVQIAEWRAQLAQTLADPNNVTATFLGQDVTAIAGNEQQVMRATGSGAGGLPTTVLRVSPADLFIQGARVDSIFVSDGTEPGILAPAVDTVIADKWTFTLLISFEIKSRIGNRIVGPFPYPIAVRVDAGDLIVSGYMPGSVADALFQACQIQGGTLDANNRCVDGDGNTLADIVAGNSSFIAQADARLEELQERVCDLEGVVATVTPPAAECNFLSCGSSKTEQDCIDAGGTYDLGASETCRFALAVCPAGWSPCTQNGQQWTATTTASCTPGCTNPVSTAPYATVSTGGHAFSNLSAESIAYYDASRCTSQTPVYVPGDLSSCSPCSLLADKSGCTSCDVPTNVGDQAVCRATVTQIGCI